MTGAAATLLAAVVAAGPSSDPPLSRHAAAGVQVGVLVGEAARLSPRVGAGMAVRLAIAPTAGPLWIHGELDHDTFGRTVTIEVRTGDPDDPVARVDRAQQLTYTALVVGAALAPRDRRRRLRPRVGVAAGAVAAFFRHPGARPETVSRWRALGRVEAGLDVRVHRWVGVEVGVQWNVVLPATSATLDLGSGEGAESHLLFDDYAAGGVRMTYAF